MNEKVLVTGAAGFIGYHTIKRLMIHGYNVVGVDNLNDYYDVKLKKNRINNLKSNRFMFKKMDICNFANISKLFRKEEFNFVIHLAAQAGVRYSIDNPFIYAQSNLVGHTNILEACRRYDTEHLIYASSSSVYGMNESTPLSEHHNVDHPVSFYAATKRSNELMSHSYSHLYDIPITGVRFFTVYGPYGRPDMSVYIFTKAAYNNDTIKLFDTDNIKRDFTYIDDVVGCVVKMVHNPPRKSNRPTPSLDPSCSKCAHKIYNIGAGNPIKINDLIDIIEKKTGKILKRLTIKALPGDVKSTYADIENIKNDFGYECRTPIDDGIEKFINWYKSYHNVK